MASREFTVSSLSSEVSSSSLLSESESAVAAAAAARRLATSGVDVPFDGVSSSLASSESLPLSLSLLDAAVDFFGVSSSEESESEESLFASVVATESAKFAMDS